MDENNNDTTPKAPKSKMSPLLIIVVALLIIGGAYWVMSQNKSATTGQENTSSERSGDVESSMPAADEQDVDESEVTGEEKTFKVTGSPFKFDPAEIRVNKGDTVIIVFTNSSGTHDWVIDQFDARAKQLQSGQTETIEFVADKAGTFEYYCSVSNHRAQGMVGKLIVDK